MGILDAPVQYGYEFVKISGRWRRRTTVLPGPVISNFNAVPSLEFTSGSASGYTFRCSHKIAVAATDLQVVFFGWQINNTLSPRENALSNSNVLKVAIEINGTIYPVAFQQIRIATLDAYGVMVSNPLAVAVNPGDTVSVRVYDNVATGSKIMKTHGMGGGAGFSPTGDGFSTGDVATSGAITTTDTGAFSNPVLCGRMITPQPSVFGLGDSIISGQADIGGTAFLRNYGFFSRAAIGAGSNGVPALKCSCVSMLAQDYAALYRWPSIAAGFTHAIVLLGRNDLSGARSTAQIEADLTTIFGAFTTRGVKVWACTIPPRTSSTDGYLTVGSQTKDSTEATRTAVNDWLRGLPAGISGCIDTADTLEVNASNVLTRNGGFWRIPTTSQAISASSLTTNVVTITTASAHGLQVGQSVVISGEGAPFDGAFIIASVPSTTTFTYAKTASNATGPATGAIFQPYTPDGIHPDIPGHLAMTTPTQTAIAAFTF